MQAQAYSALHLQVYLVTDYNSITQNFEQGPLTQQLLSVCVWLVLWPTGRSHQPSGHLWCIEELETPA